MAKTAKIRNKYQQMIIDALKTSGFMYLYGLAFTIFGIIFLADSLNIYLRIFMGIIFWVPLILLFFHLGKSDGEKDYRKANKQILSDVHSQKISPPTYYMAFVRIAPYVFVTLLLSLIASAFNLAFLRAITLITVSLPLSLIFDAADVLDIASSPVGWMQFVTVAVFIVIAAAAYSFGYIFKMYALRSQQADIVTEMRSVK